MSNNLPVEFSSKVSFEKHFQFCMRIMLDFIAPANHIGCQTSEGGISHLVLQIAEMCQHKQGIQFDC